MAPTASTTAALAAGDALAIVLLEARGFQKTDFAKLHPGGVIGKTLLYRVKDIMRTDEKFPKVSAETPVKEAIMAMTGASSGWVAKVDDDAKPIGIITDGDLRRLLFEKQNIQDTPVQTVMTKSPVTVTEEQLAVDVLKIYEQRNIDDILVVDSGGRATGLVDIQDLPKFKLF